MQLLIMCVIQIQSQSSGHRINCRCIVRYAIIRCFGGQADPSYKYSRWKGSGFIFPAHFFYQRIFLCYIFPHYCIIQNKFLLLQCVSISFSVHIPREQSRDVTAQCSLGVTIFFNITQIYASASRLLLLRLNISNSNTNARFNLPSAVDVLNYVIY